MFVSSFRDLIPLPFFRTASLVKLSSPDTNLSGMAGFTTDSYMVGTISKMAIAASDYSFSQAKMILSDSVTAHAADATVTVSTADMMEVLATLDRLTLLTQNAVAAVPKIKASVAARESAAVASDTIYAAAGMAASSDSL